MLRNILFIAVFAFAGTAFCETTINVMGKNHYQGENLVRLKRLANQQLSAMGEEASNFELVGVTMKAKSRRGQGQATLIVGQDRQTKNVGRVCGDSLCFSVTAPWSYKDVSFDLSNLPGQADERWQIRFNGNIKVRGINLILASGTRRVRIPFGGELFAGENTLFLKRELRAMGYNVRNAKLRKVVLVAKSRRGRGKAELMIGQNYKPVKTVGLAQAGYGFQSERPASFNRIRWNARGRTPGAWQIHMQGRIKVKAVIVEFKK